jgi:hypothetical protein
MISIKNFLFVALSCSLSSSYGQTPGLIFQPASGSGTLILDPNGDGYVSLSTGGFTINDQSESEIPFVPLAFPGLEPSNDLNSGPACGFTDFVDSGAEDPAMVYFDGTNLIFRLRIGNALNNSKGYSILVDTDNKFGFSGAHADPNATIQNPGFEIEICLRTNFGVYVYNVDGGCPGAAIYSYPGTTNYQKSVALTTNCSNPDYFYDFFIPMSALNGLGVTSSTPLRMAIVTQMNPQPAICNSAISDIGGINDASCGNIPGICFTNIINNFTPTSVSNINSPIVDRSQCPSINTVTAGSNSLSGSTTENNGTLISVYRNGNLIGTTVSSAGTWNLTSISPSIASGDTITASAEAPGKSVSVTDCSVKIVNSSCSPALNFSLTSECTPKKGFTGSAGSAIAGAVIKVYDASGNLVTPNAGSIYNSGTVTANPDGSWIWKCNGNSSCSAGANNCITSGTYRVTQTESGKCESNPIILCIGTSTASTTPTITGTLSSSSTSISGTAGANATVMLMKRTGSLLTLAGTTTANGSGAWTKTGIALNPCDTITAVAVQSGLCQSSYATDKIVNGGTTLVPVITGKYCAATAITSVSGYCIEPAGTMIQIYENGVAEGSPVVIQSNGTWTATSGINIALGSTITARATAPCKLQSGNSNAVVTGTITNDNILSFTTNPIIEGMTSLSGTATSGNTVTAYIDGVAIGSPVVASSGLWSITGLATYDLYPDGMMTITSASPTGCASDPVAGSTVLCLPPSNSQSIILDKDTVCNGDNTSLEIVGSENLMVYQLYLNGTATGNSILGNGNNIVLTTGPLNNSGNLILKAIKIGSSNCTSEFADSSWIYISEPASPLISYTSNRTCEGDTLLLSSSYSSNLLWSTGETTQSIQVFNSGVYSVTYTDGFGCTSTSSQAISFHTLPPTLNISSPANVGICLGDSLLLTTTYLPGVTYQWRKYGNNLPGGDTTFYMITTPGRYRVRITDLNGCTSISPFVEVTSGPAVPEISSMGSTIICQGSSVTLTTNPIPGMTYSWRKYSNPISGSAGSSYQASTAGKYSCVATDLNGCTRASASIDVAISPHEPLVIANGPTTFCYGDSVLLTVNPEFGLTYQWKKYGNLVPGAYGTSYYAKNEGQYKAVATDLNGCIRASNAIVILNEPGPVIITASGPTTFCPGSNVSLTVSPLQGATYQWKKYNNNIAGANQPSYLADKSGRYKCIITDINGCTRSSNPIDVSSSCRYAGNSGVDVYPNPSIGRFEIATSDLNSDISKIIIRDASGRITGTISRSEIDGVFYVDGLSKGIYFATISTEDTPIVVKLIKIQ